MCHVTYVVYGTLPSGLTKVIHTYQTLFPHLTLSTLRWEIVCVHAAFIVLRPLTLKTHRWDLLYVGAALILLWPIP